MGRQVMVREIEPASKLRALFSTERPRGQVDERAEACLGVQEIGDVVVGLPEFPGEGGSIVLRKHPATRPSLDGYLLGCFREHGGGLSPGGNVMLLIAY